MTNAVMPTYARIDICFDHGQGSWLYDTEGNKYLDAITGIGVCSLGHNHPAVTDTLTRQSAKLIHTSNLYRIPEQEQLATKLCQISNMKSVFFGNSGAEANEAAIKLSRLYGHQKGIKTPTIAVFENSFHGRTMATLTATGNRKVQAGFEPLLTGFVRLPYNDIEAIKKAVESNDSIVAIMLEPIQGEAGIRIPTEGFLKSVESLCRENDLLLILDEIQTGIGKTGRWFAHQHESVQPDILTLAKALGNGVPIGACLVSEKASAIFGPGNHGSTFGGNPLSCAVAYTVLDSIEKENLLNNAITQGNKLRLALKEQEVLKCVKSVRSKGLMLGIELEKTVDNQIIANLRNNGVLGNLTGTNVIRLLPPINISDNETDFLIQRLVKTLVDYDRHFGDEND